MAFPLSPAITTFFPLSANIVAHLAISSNYVVAVVISWNKKCTYILCIIHAYDFVVCRHVGDYTLKRTSSQHENRSSEITTSVFVGFVVGESVKKHTWEYKSFVSFHQVMALSGLLFDGFACTGQVFEAVPRIFHKISDLRKMDFEVIHTGGVTCEQMNESSAHAAKSLLKAK